MKRSRLVGVALVAMIVLPAGVLAVLGYRSFDTELRAERAERRDRVRQGFNRIWEAVDRALTRIDAQESARPFWDYRPLVVDLDAVKGETVSRYGPLVMTRPIPGIRGYWQVDVARRDLTNPAGQAGGGSSVRVAPDRHLQDVSEHLRRFPPPPDFVGIRSETRTHDRRLVEGNLTPTNEDQQVRPTPVAGTSEVRYGSFVYVADPPGETVYARRAVRILDAGRTLHQGFVIDVEAFLSETLPALAARAGDRDVRVRVIPTPPRSYAYPPNRPLGPMLPELSLLAEESDTDAASRSVAAARERFVLLVGALFAVIGVGLVLLQRTVQAEVVLARRRSDFVSAVSHELRTPLTGIRMYADMLRDGWVKDPETVREYHESMARESERLSRLVQNVLDFGALEKGRKDYRMERGDLVGPVREALDLLAPYLAEKGFRVETDLPDDLPEVDRDTDAVQQCVVNLVDNAVKYAKGHEPAVVEVALAHGDGRVELRVRDHGPGLPPAERERVFTAFYRGLSPSAREVGGAGLGLALVRRFAIAHGGSAGLEEAPDGGMIVRVVFPVPDRAR